MVISFVKQFSGAIICVAAIVAFTGCSTVTDMVTTNVPDDETFRSGFGGRQAA